MAAPDISDDSQLEGLEIPRHIAIIMDGNGRWAAQRGLPRIQGHFEGRKATRRVVEACAEVGVDVLSIYAFSVENWHRPDAEVEGLMELIEQALREELADLDRNNVRFIASGRISELPPSLQGIIAEAQDCTADNSGLVLNLLINYSGRAEITDAAQAIAQKAKAGEIAPEQIDEDFLSQHLYTPELPDPDMVVRPGGEMRVSNFLLWEIAYAEIVVMPVLWPDFTKQHLIEAIGEYNRRQRRFGRATADDNVD